MKCFKISYAAAVRAICIQSVWNCCAAFLSAVKYTNVYIRNSQIRISSSRKLHRISDLFSVNMKRHHYNTRSAARLEKQNVERHVQINIPDLRQNLTSVAEMEAGNVDHVRKALRKTDQSILVNIQTQPRAIRNGSLLDY